MNNFRGLLRVTAVPLVMAGMILVFTGCVSTEKSPEEKKSNALYMLGRSFLRQERLQDAFLKFQESIQVNPRNKESHSMLGEVYTRLGQYGKAIESYEKAIEIDPEFSEAYNKMSMTYNMTEEWDKAIRAGRKALDNPLYQNPEFAYNNVGRALLMKGDCRTASEAFRQALLRRPIPQAQFNLAMSYTCLGREEDAVRQLERLVERAPKYADAHFELGRLLEARGETKKARMHYSEVVKMDPDSELGIKAGERLKKVR